MRTNFLLLPVLALAFAPPQEAAVLDFEDIVTSGSVVAMPLNYGGISWEPNFGVYGFLDGPYAAQTPPNRALVNLLSVGDPDISFIFLTPSVFDGAWFAGIGSASGPISYTLELGGGTIGTFGNHLPTATPTFVATGYAGLVDRVTINGIGGWYVFDDLTYQTGGDVPEPGSGLAMSIGAATLWFVRRRRQRAYPQTPGSTAKKN